MLNILDMFQTPVNITKDNMKYLFICGCSMSGIGKGTTISSIGKLLVNQNYVVTAIKVDPYFNIDAGTMSPLEHGEVFVLDDGGEVDLDLGNYERALNATFNRNHNITSGRVFKEVLDSERRGEYLGKTIQMVPHITDKICNMISSTANAYRNKDGNKAHICLVEIGGTVGDLESSIFFEAIRRFIFQVGEDNTAVILLSYVPMIGEMNEPKTKLTQQGINLLKSAGIFPNFIICRSKLKLDDNTKYKISFGASCKPELVFSCYDTDTLADVPLILHEQNIESMILTKFKYGNPGISVNKFNCLSKLTRLCKREETPPLKIMFCGKYMKCMDAYFSVVKALEDACTLAGRRLQLVLKDMVIVAENIGSSSQKNKDQEKYLNDYINELTSADGIVCPGGFGANGFEAKVLTSKIARENRIPFLGICFGMQAAVVDFCRNELKLENANSHEIDPETDDGVITTMSDVSYEIMGGTLRLGAKEALISNKESLSYKIYGRESIYERHRHRYEVNNDYIEKIEKAGMYFSGRNVDGDRMDMLELDQNTHPFFYALQSHPEFLTKPDYPSLPFYAFILHAAKMEKEFNQFSMDRLNAIDTIEEYEKKYFSQIIMSKIRELEKVK